MIKYKMILNFKKSLKTNERIYLKRLRIKMVAT